MPSYEMLNIDLDKIEVKLGSTSDYFYLKLDQNNLVFLETTKVLEDDFKFNVILIDKSDALRSRTITMTIKCTYCGSLAAK